MCKELYQRWKECDCWGFLAPATCKGLFKTCMGPRGEIDKKVVKWNSGMCQECWQRMIEEAKDQVYEAETNSSSSHSRYGYD